MKRSGGNSRLGRKIRRERRDAWITETQMFQRIAGKPVTPAEELAKEYDILNAKKKT